MPYIVNRTDGSIVATVTDGTVDRASTSLVLIGKNYKGIGEIYNENLVHLLENFSSVTPPNNQIKGQLWFNSNSNKLNVYDGQNWRPVGSPFVTTSRPGNLVQGDLWIDNANQQLKFYDGANLVTAGPIYTVSQGKTGWIVEEILDRSGNSKIVAALYVANVRMAMLNQTQFVPLLPIPGFTTDINPLKAGLTFSSLVDNNNINAPAESALHIIDPTDGALDTSKFLRADKSGSINGSLTISSINGIIVGPNSNFTAYIDTTEGVGNNKTIIANRASNTKLVIQTKTTSEFQDCLVFDPVLKKTSVYPNDNWQSTQQNIPELNVNANTVIQGTLTVVGQTQFTNSTTLQIADKNVELAVVQNPTDVTANGAGITVLGASGNNKTITWLSGGIYVSPSLSLSAWQLSDNIRIPSLNSYYVGNNSVLSSTTLGSTVVNSSLTSVGSLVNLTAAQFNLTNNKLTVNTGSDFVISVDVTKAITLENRVRISNLADPIPGPSGFYDAATRNYVDRVKTAVNYITIDITGLANPNTDAVAQIDALIPAVSVELNDIVRVLCLSYTNGVSTPVVNRIVKIFRCEPVVGVRTWVHQTGQDVAV
jgi:hypothetical protein